MRFRKVRSFLSAYCNDELSGKRHDAVREHIAQDERLQAEARAFGAIRKVSEELPGMKVSKDFNADLLNRIAEERFAETRSRAYLPPTRVPSPRWMKVAPAMAAAMLVVAVGIGMLAPEANLLTPPAGQSTGLDNRYLTAQPVSNPNATLPLPSNWSLDRELQRSQRINQIFSTMTSNHGFVRQNQFQTGLQTVSVQRSGATPFVTTYYQVRPILKVYQATSSREDGTVY
jgi:hypothetical protein